MEMKSFDSVLAYVKATKNPEEQIGFALRALLRMGRYTAAWKELAESWLNGREKGLDYLAALKGVYQVGSGQYGAAQTRAIMAAAIVRGEGPPIPLFQYPTPWGAVEEVLREIENIHKWVGAYRPEDSAWGAQTVGEEEFCRQLIIAGEGLDGIDSAEVVE